MTKDASFKKVVRRHAEETGQRYTEALTDLEGLGARMDHEPSAERLLSHLRDRYGIDPVAATKLSVHKTYVFRIDRNDGSPWVARAFPPARPRAGAEGDAAILGFLERQDYPAERLAAEQLRDQVRSADDGHGLPEGLLHGNLLHAPDHAVLSGQGPVAINWKASGRGPRLADLAYLIWGAGSWHPRRPNQEWIDAAVSAYRRHIEPTDDELSRLEGVMYIRTLYLACFGYRRALINGSAFRERGFIEPPGYFSSTAAATRAAFRR